MNQLDQPAIPAAVMFKKILVSYTAFAFLMTLFMVRAEGNCFEVVDKTSSHDLQLKILIMPFGGALAHTTRPLEIARELRGRGHLVSFAGEGKYLRIVESEGFEVIKLVSLDGETVQRNAENGELNDYTTQTAIDHIKGEIALINEVKPDLVISDLRMTVSTAAELTGVKHVSILNSSWTNYYEGDRIIPEHFKVGGWNLGRVAKPITQWMNRSRLTRPLAQRPLRWIEGQFLREGAKVLNEARESFNLPPFSNMFEAMEGDLNILADLPAYSPTSELPNHFKQVGPLTWSAQSPPPVWFNSLDRSRPIVYVTMGSSGNRKYVDAAIEEFRDSNFQLIITTGNLKPVDNAPKNVFSVDFAPGDLMMEIADVVVCQGGNGTVYQAIRSGKPLVGIPVLPDQEIYNMLRVEQMGLGISLSDLGYRRGNIRKAAEKLLRQRDSLRFKKKMQELQAELEVYDGARRATDEIESLFRR